MSFTSHIFVFYFLPLVLLGYTLIRQNLRFPRKVFLLIASYVFYGWLNPWFVALVFGTTCFNYILSKQMARSESKGVCRALITIAVTINLGLLAFFKYAGFFQDNFNHVLKIRGSGTMPVLHVVLPVGISFYTFRVLSYVIDVYRGGRPAPSFLDFACYVAFFPQLI
jgi:alginate O-acetyltransferase complex protein AlgI